MNLDKSNLNISILRGSVNLYSLYIKESSINELLLPIHCQYGFINNIQLYANWTKLKYEPVKFIINGIYLIVKAKKSTNNNNRTEAQIINELQNIKQKLLEKLTSRLLELEQLKYKDNNNNKDKDNSDGYLSRLATLIVDNVQITINDVHIQYIGEEEQPNIMMENNNNHNNNSNDHHQNKTTDNYPVVPYTFGIGFDTLTAMTQDEHGN